MELVSSLRVLVEFQNSLEWSFPIISGSDLMESENNKKLGLLVLIEKRFHKFPQCRTVPIL